LINPLSSLGLAIPAFLQPGPITVVNPVESEVSMIEMNSDRSCCAIAEHSSVRDVIDAMLVL
jgi:tRNA A37 threonylcarbamoyladenosine synthetase subunit TsaC/SUA5/YrdC